jgi:ribosomal protein S18 acetylase RimI-like enzyme
LRVQIDGPRSPYNVSGFAHPLCQDSAVPKLRTPPLHEVLAFCAENPVERVFLEDIARRGLGRFLAVPRKGNLQALCHFGMNIGPAGSGCGVFARQMLASSARMIVGADDAVSELWQAAERHLPPPRRDSAREPVYELREQPEPGESGLRPARISDLKLLLPACAAAHKEELAINPIERDPEGFRWRTRVQITAGRSWLWEEKGAILFKAEASAWTPSAVQLQQVWTDPDLRGRGYARRALRDLCRLLLERTPCVCLFVRAENEPAIRLYESVGMERSGYFRSIVL